MFDRTPHGMSAVLGEGAHPVTPGHIDKLSNIVHQRNFTLTCPNPRKRRTWPSPRSITANWNTQIQGNSSSTSSRQYRALHHGLFWIPNGSHSIDDSMKELWKSCTPEQVRTGARKMSAPGPHMDPEGPPKPNTPGPHPAPEPQNQPKRQNCQPNNRPKSHIKFKGFQGGPHKSDIVPILKRNTRSEPRFGTPSHPFSQPFGGHLPWV